MLNLFRGSFRLTIFSLFFIAAGCDSRSPEPVSGQSQQTKVVAPITQDKRSLSIMAPAAPGGGWDQTARTMQKVIQDNNLAANIQVINIPGAGGTIGLAQMVNAQKGNNNYLMVTGLIMLGAILTNGSAVTLEQVTPLARLIGEYEVLVVPADSPHQTLADFITAWQNDPGSMVIAGGSAGGADHMLVGLMAREVGIPMSQVNYLPHSGGGDSLASLLGSHVTAGINGYAELEAFINAGRLRALALSSKERLAGLDIPTFIEQGMDVELANWRSVAAPPGINATQKAELLTLIDSIYSTDEWQSALVTNNWIDLYMYGPEYEAFLQEEYIRVADVLKSIGLVE